jgi:CubicO group peptidase (beta-lactamase class C family)
MDMDRKTKYMRTILVITFLFAITCCEAQLTTHESKVIAGLSKDLTDDVRKDGLHGSMSAAIIRKGKVIWAEAFGYDRSDAETPADTNTLYRIASLTKSFTATLLMMLVEEGKVDLEDPLDKYVPEAKTIPGYSRITLKELASHTAGLSREPGLKGVDLGPVSQWENTLLSCLPYTTFNSLPGTQYLYSNIGFALLGLALERATGIPYTDLVRQKIFEPLQMEHTFFVLPEDQKNHIAEGLYNNKGSDFVNRDFPRAQIDGMGYRVPNGGIWSTPADFGKFIIGLTTGVLLKPRSLRLMLTVPNSGKNYALGIDHLHDKELDLIGHAGSDPGYTSQYAIEPRSGDAVVIFRNYNEGRTILLDEARDVLEGL